MAVICFVGKLGSGKTCSLVDWVAKDFRHTYRQVFTNMRSLKIPEQSYLDIDRPEQLAEITEGLLVYDEAQIAFSSRSWQQVPKEALMAMAQFRKNGLDVVMTTQNMERVDSVFRSLVTYWVHCFQVGPFVVQSWKEAERAKRGRLKVILRTPALYALFDSWEVLKRPANATIARSEVLEALKDRRTKRATDVGGSALGRWLSRLIEKCGSPFEVSPFVRIGNTYSLTQEARSAREWLAGRHGCDARLNGDALVGELRRRAWLRWFGLRVEDVPTDTTLEDPWTKGGGPADKPELEATIVDKRTRVGGRR